MSSSFLPLKFEALFYRKKMEGAIDLQIHLAPDIAERSSDEIEFARRAAEVGYRAYVSKCHHAVTADRAYLVNRLVPGIRACGSVVLNHTVGGLNPDAVEIAIILGSKEVWMPTLHAANHINHFKVATLPTLRGVKQLRRSSQPIAGISVLSHGGEVSEKVDEILGMIADADIILGTGHISLSETYALTNQARKLGVKKILITHPEFAATNLPAEDQVKLAEMGAVLEHCATRNYDANLIASNIRRVGADHCVISSDSGQIEKGHPIDTLYRLTEDLQKAGISEREIRKMTCENPAKLLALD